MEMIHYLTPLQVARKEGCSASWIHRILKGEAKKHIDDKYIVKIAGHYFISKDYKITSNL